METFFLFSGLDEEKIFCLKLVLALETLRSYYYYFDFVYPLVWVYIVIPEYTTSKKGWVMCRKKKLKKRNKYNNHEITKLQQMLINV